MRTQSNPGTRSAIRTLTILGLAFTAIAASSRCEAQRQTLRFWNQTPSFMISGGTITVTVTLTNPAPYGGTTVWLTPKASLGNTSVTPATLLITPYPDRVFIPGGATTGSRSFKTRKLAAGSPYGYLAFHCVIAGSEASGTYITNGTWIQP